MEGQEQEAKNTLAEMLQVIDKANYPDDVIKLLQDMKLMSSN